MFGEIGLFFFVVGGFLVQSGFFLRVRYGLSLNLLLD